MRFSIITPTLNQAQFIEKTIVSVLSQSFPDFEHIVIDGGSTDGTLDILKRYPHLKWISEKDRGQSDAINKGFKMATGDIVAWLNSDDFYENGIFDKIHSFFQNNFRCSFLYGDITFVDINEIVLFKTNHGNICYKTLLSNPDIVRQPSCFWRSSLLKDVGYLNENLHLVMDFEFFLRIAKKTQMHYMPENLSYFRMYDEGKSLKYAKKQLFELFKLMIRTPAVYNPRSYLYFYRKLKTLKSL